MRVIGIDFGERHIGLATADDRVPVAVPLATVDAGGDPVARIEEAVREQGAEVIVFGLPLSMSGAEGPQAQRVREIAGLLAERIAIPIDFQDERLTSAQAERTASGKGARKDAIAASILLQAYLDQRR
jgi:putative Holliday junction resolvase